MLKRAAEVRPQVTQTSNWPAPSQGWVQSGNVVLAPKEQAELLDNFIPTAQGIRLRGGITEYADLSSAVVRLFTYRSGATEEMFGATATDIFDTSDVGSGAVRSSLTSGDWSTTQISTSGGQFLVGVNGADTGWTYNGTTFSDISLTGVASTALSQVWIFKERLFFVEEDTTSVWYLPVESIGGTVAEIDLGAVMAKGGSILFGATWSLDSGAGIDDVCVFVTTAGELIVYEGTDPASANTWSLVGVYDVGEPLNKHGFFKTGGDLAILTEDGIIAVAEALRKDRAALSGTAITYPIEDAWKKAVRERSTSYPINAELWQSSTLLVVGTPDTYRGRRVAFVANARTGAWARITGWDVRCQAILSDELYFGSNDGKVYKADDGGTDAGSAYTATWVPKFETSSEYRTANAVGVVYLCPAVVTADLDAWSDYAIGELPEPATSTVEQGSTWGTGVWGTFVWGSGEKTAESEWQAAWAQGYSLTPSYSITVNQTNKIDLEPVILKLRHETGYVL